MDIKKIRRNKIKNYQLIEELMKLPASYGIKFYKAGEEETEVLEDITDIETDESNKTITLLCE